ncbi:hypothetical protein MU582_08945 [Nocardioidaceae bacterium SCSIO 66511]|nr:hypothetical protein MU582_08945 [Nocardioidaceae bacterium SCSIO 66511]
MTSTSVRSDRAGAGAQLVRDLLASYAASRRVGSVAVVGNAPLEPDAERAKQVDAADLVIRCNSFMLDDPGAPPTQGSSVHAVVFSRGLLPTAYSFARYRDCAYLVTEPSRIYADAALARYVKEWPTWWPRDLGFLAVPNGPFTFPLLDELGLPWRERLVVPTTGMMAIAIARTCFPAADLMITGFSMIDQPQQTEWRHQAGDSSPIGGAHYITAESRTLRRWIDNGEVRFVR